MREIKFRAKRIDNGEWVYGYYAECDEFYDNGGVENHYREGYATLYYIVDRKGHPFLVDPETVGQYTELKDKHGKEVFKGDILRDQETDCFKEHERYLVVEWLEFECGFAFKRLNTGMYENSSDLVNEDTLNLVLEVVGNIHDNPELLKADTIKCYQCHRECKKIYQVKVIDEIGKTTYEKVCSEECALEVKEELYYLHKKRANDMKEQLIQRLE